MKQEKELNYYDKIKKWDFSTFEIEEECLTNWDLYELLTKLTNKDSKVLDLGTGGGEKLLKFFPPVHEIIGTDFSSEMIKTAHENLVKSKRLDVKFKVMDNLNMDVEDNYFDVVVARHTIIDPKQIYKCLKKGGYLLVRGVDKADCLRLKQLFKRGQGYLDSKPISIIDYENILDAGFTDVELVPIHVREYFKSKEELKEFLKLVPILDEFSEIDDTCTKREIEDDLLDKYVSLNTYNGKIRLVRRYYGISAKKK